MKHVSSLGVLAMLFGAVFCAPALAQDGREGGDGNPDQSFVVDGYYNLAALATEEGMALAHFVPMCTRIMKIALISDPRLLVGRKAVMELSLAPHPTNAQAGEGYWLSPSDLEDLFHTILRVHSLGVEEVFSREGEVKGQPIFRLIQSSQLKESGGPRVSREELAKLSGSRYATIVVALKHTDSQLVYRAIINMLSKPDGHAQPVSVAEAVLISDYAANLKRLVAVIEEIEATGAARAAGAVRVFDCGALNAKSAAGSISEALGMSVLQRNPYTMTPTPRVVGNQESCTITVMSDNEAHFATAERLIAELLEKQAALPALELRSLPLSHRDAEQAQKVLTDLLRQRAAESRIDESSILLSADPDARRLMVRAPAQHMPLIEQLLKEFDQPLPETGNAGDDSARQSEVITPEMVDLEDGFKSVKKHYDPATNREVRRQVSMKIHLEVHPSDAAFNRAILEKAKPIIRHKVGGMLDRKSWADVQALDFRDTFAVEIRDALNHYFGTEVIKNVWLELELN